ncbi:GNAT family N-acetyltransferase [Steroidobacter sp. S1-65]|uniref:Acyl-homoserine-lactone synthase n=1 Tax=Steroidobacter gossypii TaxID=2805490 RepID=A0ABS1X641_9GAMM|nr:acyl-homoserine-lactone synthase [Steroidobacter gossypii]MBM0108660.1 GNAT family N-acetyltransferase [Steroidobacter gossypii]
MILIVNAENRSLFVPELIEMHRQRKVVFVDKQGWNVPVIGDMEVDDYDAEDTTYLIAKADGGSAEVLASARLLPTVRPHLMTDLFANACERRAPRGPRIWEVSRFCVSPAIASRRKRIELLWETACGVIETALLYGVQKVTFVANAALLPLALECGWKCARLGPTLPDGDDEITAVVASITPNGLRAVRRRLGIDAPVTRFALSTVKIAA